MAAEAPVIYSVAIPTVIGSILSMIGAGFILICYLILPTQRHFRHALIINLAISDFINAVNNTVSGLYVTISGHDLPAGGGCVTNAFIGQLSVQATDIGILMIAVITLFTLRGVFYIPDDSLIAKIAVCAAVWVIPIVTSFTGLGLGVYVPIAGNWCWIEEDPTYLRYVLTHGWRFLSIIVSTIIYINILLFFNKHFAQLRQFSGGSSRLISTQRSLGSMGTNNYSIRSFEEDDIEKRDEPQGIQVKQSVSVLDNSNSDTNAPLEALPTGSPDDEDQEDGHHHSLSHVVDHIPLDTWVARGRAFFSGRFKKDNRVSKIHPFTVSKQEAKIRRTLLLNAYPIMYILLWIPGIANRISDATGHDSIPLQILQSSTQFVGLANAITYGINERVWEQMKRKFSKAKSLVKRETPADPDAPEFANPFPAGPTSANPFPAI